MIQNFTGEYCKTKDFKRDIEKRISDYLLNQGLLSTLKEKLEQIDTNHSGKVNSE